MQEGVERPKVYTSPREVDFHLEVDQAGFYFFHMKAGGVRPTICEKKYTTRKLAMRDLEKYFKDNPKVIHRHEKKKLQKKK